MEVVTRLMMFSMAVSDMPKAKALYVDKLGFKVTKDYHKDNDNWSVSLTFPEGGASITLTTAHQNMKSGAMKLYSATSDIAAAHKDLSAKSAIVKNSKTTCSAPGQA